MRREIEPGLSSGEAGRRLAAAGPNAVSEPRVSLGLKIGRRFWEPVPWMLEAAIVLQLTIGEYTEAAIIAALLVFNAVLGLLQEERAGAALAALKTKLALKASVKRDGKWIEIEADCIVPGDLVRLTLGRVVPADVRIGASRDRSRRHRLCRRHGSPRRSGGRGNGHRRANLLRPDRRACAHC